MTNDTIKCPRCKGFGCNSGDNGNCTLCNGEGHVIAEDKIQGRYRTTDHRKEVKYY